MSDLTISIFDNKIFLEIINEIKLFSKFKIKYYEDLDLCVKDAKKQNLLVIFFVSKKYESFFNKREINNFPSILIVESSTPKNMFYSELREQLNMPFAILEFEKKLISLIAKNEFKNNSLIQLNDYVIDKNIIYFIFSIKFFSSIFKWEIYFLIIFFTVTVIAPAHIFFYNSLIYFGFQRLISVLSIIKQTKFKYNFGCG